MKVPNTSVEVDDQCLKDVGGAVRDSLRWGAAKGNMKDPEAIELARDLVFQRLQEDNPEAPDKEIYFAIGVLMKVIQNNLKERYEST